MEPAVSHPTRNEEIAGTIASAGSPTFAVAFGGGGARGLAHIHVIEALDELGIRPVAISGTSIGAIMGAAMASGMTGAEIHTYASSILGQRAELAARIWRARPESISDMLDGGVRLGQFNVERILRSFLPERLPATFEELQIPLQLVATDYFAHEQIVFDSGELVHAIGASAALPAVFRPVRHEGRLLIDGNFTNPVPFDLLEGKADIIIAIDVIGAPKGEGTQPVASIDLMMGATQILMESIMALKLQKLHPQVLLRPPVSRYKVLDFLRIEQVMSDTIGLKDEVKDAVEAAVLRFSQA